MVLFFALFGFLFLSTQYLQFVLGYSPSAAGVRVLPYAGAMIVFAPLSSKLVLRLGTKRVVTTGMLLFAAGLAVAATVTAGAGYGRLGVALLLMGAGMGLAGAPATESIMGSLPPERANIGSAVNDTTRELGGALGVAIVGSIMSSLYSTQLSRKVPGAQRPAESLGRGRPGRHRRRRRGARSLRPRDVARVARGRDRGGARRRDRVAPSPLAQRRRGRRRARHGTAAGDGELVTFRASMATSAATGVTWSGNLTRFASGREAVLPRSGSGSARARQSVGRDLPEWTSESMVIRSSSSKDEPSRRR